MGPVQEIFEVFPSEATCLKPLGVRVNGVIVSQAISAVDYATGNCESTLSAQMQACFARMQELVERGGAMLRNVGRVVCYVTQAEHREPVYEEWEKLFPDAHHRPAFKVLTGPLPGQELVRLDVLAVPGAEPRRLDLDGIPARDPTVVVGDRVFTSRLHGISPRTHETSTGLRAQLAQALANAEELVRLAGGATADISQVSVFARDEESATTARQEVERLVGSGGTHYGLRTWVRPDSEVMVEAVAQIGRRPDTEFLEIFLDAPGNNKADGFRLGDLVFAPELSSGTAAHDVEGQIRTALQKMDSLLRIGGANRDEVARVTFYMSDLRERATLNKIWQEWYPDPDNRPPHTYLPVALPNGQSVTIQVIALAGARRRVIKVEGVEHGDPMSLATVTGNLLTTSRIFGAGGRETPEGLKAHTERCFANATALLRNAGVAWSEVRQVVAYGSSGSYGNAVRDRMAQITAGAAVPCRLDFLETDLARGTLLPRLQLLALTENDGMP